MEKCDRCGDPGASFVETDPECRLGIFMCPKCKLWWDSEKRGEAISRYIVIGSSPWSTKVYQETICTFPGEWYFLDAPDLDHLRSVKPSLVFFLHYSKKVPDEIVNGFECVLFHMTDVPFGRGGSPLQNLITRGLRKTKLTALRMTSDFDAGPVYLQKDLCLEGNAEEIYLRATRLAAEMIRQISLERPIPRLQTGDVTVFKRRRPEESQISTASSLLELHDHIRMLDAEGYPKAFIDFDGFRFEFSRAALYSDRIKADVEIRKFI